MYLYNKLFSIKFPMIRVKYNIDFVSGRLVSELNLALTYKYLYFLSQKKLTSINFFVQKSFIFELSAKFSYVLSFTSAFLKSLGSIDILFHF